MDQRRRATQGVPMGHTVRKIAAPPQALDAMFRQAGVVQVDTLDEMFDVAQLLAHQPLPRGRRVAIVGNSDALGSLSASAAESLGLQVTHGPVSLLPQASAEEFAISRMLALISSVPAATVCTLPDTSAEEAPSLATVALVDSA